MVHQTRMSRAVRWVIVIGVAVVVTSASVVLGWNAYRAALASREKTTTVARLRKDTYPASVSARFPHFYEPKPDSVMNDKASWMTDSVSYSINHDALNERMEYGISKPAHTYRIVTLGDSFTFGLFVNTFENYSELLEDTLNASSCHAYDAFEVINLGVPAYDVGYMTERFRLRGQKYQPDLVVLFLNPFTMRIDAERKTSLEAEYLRVIPEGERMRMIDGLEQYYPGMLAWFQHLREEPEQERVAKQASYLSDLLSAYRGKLLVVANNWDSWTPYTQFSVKSVLFGQADVRLFTELPRLTEQRGLFPDTHPNAEGHRIIAQSLYRQLTEAGGTLHDLCGTR